MTMTYVHMHGGTDKNVSQQCQMCVRFVCVDFCEAVALKM